MIKASGLYRPVLALAFGLGTFASAHAGGYSALYAFGDSLSDSGNDYLITGGLVPTATYYTDGTSTGRFTNGLNYLDRLAGSLGLSLAPSVAGGGNYAYGGARTDYVSPGLPPTALSFNQQLDAYYGSHVTADPNALYVLWIGANDMADAIKAAALGNTTAITTAVTTAVGGIGNAIGGLASLGAQHFLVPNLPDLSLTPAIRAFGSAGLTALAHGASAGFNTNLATTLDLGVFAALDIRTLDAFAAQTEITANPVAYGFSNVTQACYTGEVDGSALPHGPTPSVCADPAAYLYWDYEHPTAALHAELAGRAYAAAVPEPAVWLLLIAGAGFGALVRRARAA